MWLRTCPSVNGVVSKYVKSIFWTVSGAAEHKNFPRLCEAIQLLEDPEISLVSVGNTGKIADRYSNVIKLNDVSDSQLMALYKNSVLFVFVSLDEGFGIPLLEAMAFGKPVVCSDISVFREIIGNDAVYCNPGERSFDRCCT